LVKKKEEKTAYAGNPLYAKAMDRIETLAREGKPIRSRDGVHTVHRDGVHAFAFIVIALIIQYCYRMRVVSFVAMRSDIESHVRQHYKSNLLSKLGKYV
jgi:hypothetical protein